MPESVTVNAAPSGSAETVLPPNFGPEVIGTTQLNALANNVESAAMAYSNSSGQTLARVEVLLGIMTPGSGATVQITSGSSAYELSLSTTANRGRRAVFVDIPASFLTSFKVKNLTGVSFPASDNYVLVAPQY
jgi:hypothetical protein